MRALGNLEVLVITSEAKPRQRPIVSAARYREHIQGMPTPISKNIQGIWWEVRRLESTGQVCLSPELSAQCRYIRIWKLGNLSCDTIVLIRALISLATLAS